ncbi:MAG: Flp family type IVb pilin [Alphaproteobacteria bacterium]
MLKLYLTLQNLWADKRGVTAIEYAVLAGGVATALAFLLADGSGLSAIEDTITNALGEVENADPGTD